MGPISFDGSPNFMGLPLEVRLEIYRLVFRGARLIYQIETADSPPDDSHTAILQTPIAERSLLCTNRQARREALSLFYHMCELTLHGDGWSAGRVKTLLPQLLVQTARIVRCKHMDAPMLTRPSVFPSLRWFRLPKLTLHLTVIESEIEDVKLEDAF